MREQVVQADEALERDIFFMMRPLLMSTLPSICRPLDRSLEAFDSTSSQLVLYPKSIRRLIINSRIPSHQLKRHQTQQSYLFSKYDQLTAPPSKRLMQSSNPYRKNQRITRWALYLAQFTNMKVVHRPGRVQRNADALSRLQQRRTTKDCL